MAEDTKAANNSAENENAKEAAKAAGNKTNTGAGDKDTKAAKKAAEKVIVIKEFRDKNNFEKKYKVGDNVAHFDAERIEDLVEKKLVEIK